MRLAAERRVVGDLQSVWLPSHNLCRAREAVAATTVGLREQTRLLYCLEYRCGLIDRDNVTLRA